MGQSRCPKCVKVISTHYRVCPYCAQITDNIGWSMMQGNSSRTGKVSFPASSIEATFNAWNVSNCGPPILIQDKLVLLTTGALVLFDVRGMNSLTWALDADVSSKRGCHPLACVGSCYVAANGKILHIELDQNQEVVLEDDRIDPGDVPPVVTLERNGFFFAWVFKEQMLQMNIDFSRDDFYQFKWISLAGLGNPNGPTVFKGKIYVTSDRGLFQVNEDHLTRIVDCQDCVASACSADGDKVTWEVVTNVGKEIKHGVRIFDIPRGTLQSCYLEDAGDALLEPRPFAPVHFDGMITVSSLTDKKLFLINTSSLETSEIRSTSRHSAVVGSPRGFLHFVDKALYINGEFVKGLDQFLDDDQEPVAAVGEGNVCLFLFRDHILKLTSG